jgi:hypothetical protein
MLMIIIIDDQFDIWHLFYSLFSPPPIYDLHVGCRVESREDGGKEWYWAELPGAVVSRPVPDQKAGFISSGSHVICHESDT